jgi:hypothetical protein
LDGLKQLELELFTSGVTWQIKDIEAVDKEKNMNDSLFPTYQRINS